MKVMLRRIKSNTRQLLYGLVAYNYKLAIIYLKKTDLQKNL